MMSSLRFSLECLQNPWQDSVACQSNVEDTWLFFTSTQPLNLDKNSSSALAADRHMCFPGSLQFFKVLPPVYGLLCNKDRNLIMICNPSTGEYITLPNTTNESTEMKKPYFVYDPIEKQYKVLCVSTRKHQVLTLENGGRLLWRMVERSIPHTPKCVGICINGKLYYKAMGNQLMIVRFDVRSEKFKFITINDYEAVKIQFSLRTLINYQGKLGALITDTDGMFHRATTCIEFWVLDDVEEHKWWRHYYMLPPLWVNLVENYRLYIVGMARNGEIVLASLGLYDPLISKFFITI